MSKISRANRQFEAFLGIDLNAPREDTIRSYDELSRIRHEPSGEIRPETGEPVCRWKYNPKTREIEYFPLEE